MVYFAFSSLISRCVFPVVNLLILAVESRWEPATLEACLLCPSGPLALPLQRPTGGCAAGSRAGRQAGGQPRHQRPRMSGGHRLQGHQTEAHPAADHAGLVRVPAAGGGPGGHDGLDPNDPGEEQD